MFDILFKAIGAAGILFICAGVLGKESIKNSIFYLLGGICLEIYSIFLGDLIFIILQGVFIIVAAYKLIRLQRLQLRTMAAK